MTILQFGKVQLRIMKLLWEKRRMTARELTEELNNQAPIAHSTVQTLLRTLEGKGAVGHVREGRTFFFHPLIEDDQALRHATDSFIDNVFEGSPGVMVSYLVKKQYLSPDELKNIAALIESSGKESTS